ncbi:MAG TPA: hypothetical protein VII95_00510 [Terriglobales bacterium]|jgi:hypothetical protein
MDDSSLELSLRATDLLGQVETGMTKVKTHIDSIGFASLSLGAKRGICFLALERPLRKQQIPRGLKAVRDDNSNSRSRALLMQQSNKAREYYKGLDAA